MRSFLGFLHWQVQPRGMACPFAAGAYSWLNGEQVGHNPVAVFESLVVLQAMSAEPWRAPVAGVQTLCLESGLHKTDQMLLGRWWEGPGLVLFVDGAHEARLENAGFLGIFGCPISGGPTFETLELATGGATVPGLGGAPRGLAGLYYSHTRE